MGVQLCNTFAGHVYGRPTRVCTANGRKFPLWLKAFDGPTPEEPTTTTSTSATSSSTGVPSTPDATTKTPSTPRTSTPYTFGWDMEMKAAYRAHPLFKKREYCSELAAPAGAAPTDDVLATWPDGVTWSVPGVTCADIASPSNPNRTKLTPLWSGKFHKGDEEVSLKPCSSKDKTWLIIWCGKKQISQLVTHNLPEGKQEECKKLMVDLAKEFAAGHIDKAQVNDRKKKTMLHSTTTKRSAPKNESKAKRAKQTKAEDESDASGEAEIACETVDESESENVEGQDEEDKDPAVVHETEELNSGDDAFAWQFELDCFPEAFLPTSFAEAKKAGRRLALRAPRVLELGTTLLIQVWARTQTRKESSRLTVMQTGKSYVCCSTPLECSYVDCTQMLISARPA